MATLKQIRESQNLTQEELSEKSRISVRTIQRIEAGTIPKGHTLKRLSKTLEISENVLLKDSNIQTNTITTPETAISEMVVLPDYSKIKLINLSSILFVVLPPLNILMPLFLGHVFRQKNSIIKQIVSIQLLWTILAPIIFLSGILLKLGRGFTLVLIAAIMLSNIFIILRNAYEIDKQKKLRYQLNFSLI